MANQLIAITQNGISCAISLSPSSAHIGYTGGTGTLAVVDNTPNCPWTATSNNSWISLTTGQSGSGNGTVGYAISNSTSYLPQTGTISVSTASFSVTQDAYPCTYSFSPPNLSVPAAGGNFTIGVTTTCTWTASTTTAWIAINAGSGTTGDGVLSITVAPNTASASRSGTIQFNDQSYTVTQPSNCSFVVSPSSFNIVSGGGQYQIIVEASNACSWAVQDPVTWISNVTIGGISTSFSSGIGTVGYTVAANSSSQSRTATLTVANQPVAISQAALEFRL